MSEQQKFDECFREEPNYKILKANKTNKTERDKTVETIINRTDMIIAKLPYQLFRFEQKEQENDRER